MLIPFGVFSAGVSNGGAAGSFDLISTTLLTGSQASVTFDVTGLGATYKHLQIRAVVKDTETTYAGRNALMRFNSSTSGYYSHQLYGDGSSVSSVAISNSVQGYCGVYSGSTTSTAFSPLVIEILDAFSTTKNKTVRSLSGATGANVMLASFLWGNTAAVTSAEVIATGSNFASGSRFSLYGIKGA